MDSNSLGTRKSNRTDQNVEVDDITIKINGNVTADENVGSSDGEDGDLILKRGSREQTGSGIRDSLNILMEEYDDDDDDDEDYDDYDEEEDSDLESAMRTIREKWFCINCTMGNFDDVSLCEVCGEQRESKIFTHDCSLSSSAEDSNSSKMESKGIFQEGTVIGFDERMLLHFELEMKSHPHPERPDRLRAIMAALSASGLFPGRCHSIPAREITAEELHKVHSVDHVTAVESTKHLLLSYFTSDTYANEHSACAARLAAGLCSDLASAIMSGRSKNGFALVRPPGHHAGVKHAMGFCLHNNAAVAALAARAAGAKRVLIVDWDVHHGNGTQEIFDADKSVLYVSLHRHEYGRFYPGTGAAEDVGTMDAKGYCVNIPWKCGGVGDNDYIFAFEHVALPIASAFDPDLTIISAGFDAARGDPLGACDVTPNGYAKMTQMLNKVSKGRLLVILEGGYNLRSISSSATAVVKVLLGEEPSSDMSETCPSRMGLLTVLEVLSVQLEFWPILKSNYENAMIYLDSLKSVKTERKRKRRARHGPIWWKWGSKRLAYGKLFRRAF